MDESGRVMNRRISSFLCSTERTNEPMWDTFLGAFYEKRKSAETTRNMRTSYSVFETGSSMCTQTNVRIKLAWVVLFSLFHLCASRKRQPERRRKSTRNAEQRTVLFRFVFFFPWLGSRISTTDNSLGLLDWQISDSHEIWFLSVCRVFSRWEFHKEQCCCFAVFTYRLFTVWRPSRRP